jgi:hypothetical protein
MTITKVLNVLKEEQQENHIQGPDEARQKTNIKTIQSQWALRTIHHSLPLGPSDVIKRGKRSVQL